MFLILPDEAEAEEVASGSFTISFFSSWLIGVGSIFVGVALYNRPVLFRSDILWVGSMLGIVRQLLVIFVRKAV